MFIQNNIPKIYAYRDEAYEGCLKIGYTTKTAKERVREQYPVKTPHQTWEIVLEEVAMRVLMNIEGFRSLNKDIETIINKSESVKKAKKKATESEKELTKEEKKQLPDEEKEYKSKRKEIQEKLIKFATRIPVFMYLSEHREQTLRDVITQLEPVLFKKVTGLEVKDFELLESLGLFNGDLMNDAVFKFKQYEDSSLSYTGIPTYKGLRVGGFNTTKEERKEYENEE